MLKVGRVLISQEVLETRFACDLQACKGICCREGDLGAYLRADEIDKISSTLPRLQSIIGQRQSAFLSEGIYERHQGSLHIREMDYHHPCPFSHEKNTILYCALHTSCLEDNAPILSRKPQWCALYPLVLKPGVEQWCMNVQILPMCRCVPDPPPILLNFEKVLTELFGKDWMAEVKRHLPAMPG